MQRLDSVLCGFLREIASDPERALVFLKELWPQIVGAELAEKTTPRALRGKTLILTVPSQEWRNQLQLMVDLLSSSINAFWGFPLVETIHFRVRLSSQKESTS